MIGKLMKKPVTSYKDPDHMPKPKPLSKHVKALTEEQLQNAAASDPDAGAIPPGFWEEATVIMPPEKIKVGIRLDSDVVEWFKSTGKGYQTRINAVLKSYMDAHKEAG